MSLIIPLLIGLISIIVPGFFLALALLKKTGLPLFEIAVIGFIFGLIFPPTMIWLESYLIPVSSAFTFSNTLYNINIVILTIIGIVGSIWQGAFGGMSIKGFNAPKVSIKQETERDYRKRLASLRSTISGLTTDIRLIKQHEKEEADLASRHAEEAKMLGNIGAEERRKILELHAEQERRLFESHEAEEKQMLNQSSPAEPNPYSNSIIWIALLLIMFLVFATRMLSIGAAPNYFEFDPYYDMISTQYILTYGYQLLYTHAAWPTLFNGTIQRLQPIVPYLEAYWYNLAGATPSSHTINTTLLSQVSSFYPPIVAALLVFVVFMFIKHEYGDFWGIVAAGLTAAMPVLITTFIAGEQLLEPWGIFAMFFFYAAYLLAVNNPDDKRLSILAGIAFASNFLGAHYYTVTAGILAFYIVLQGVVNVLRGKDNKSFFKMNAIVIAVIVIFYIFYNAYGATLTERTSSILGIPIVIGLGIFALIGIFILDILVKWLKKMRSVVNLNSDKSMNYIFLGILLVFLLAMLYALYTTVGYLIFIVPLILLAAVAYPIIALHVLRESPDKTVTLKVGLEVLMVLAVIVGLVIFFTPLGKGFFSYIQLSKKFTTPSSPLFMTVQEYAPTGANFNFGNNGFGIIGLSIGGVNIVIWSVLVAFSLLTVYAIYSRDSKSSILSYAAVWPVAIAGLIEVKYLPHFGVGYIIAICVILGEVSLIYSKHWHTKGFTNQIKVVLIGIGVLILLMEAINPAYSLLAAASNSSCTSIENGGNQIGAALYCNTLTVLSPAWIPALAWMKANVGPYAPRVLAWWDYGDWINWFGNSNAVIRGDNSVAAADYAVAAHYVLSQADGINNAAIASFMNGNQSKYILFDDQLLPKWGALDFLACIDVNQTSYQYALADGGPGSSNCEINHDPAYINIPLSQNVNYYCQFPGNVTTTALKGIVTVGEAKETNITYCVPLSLLQSGNPGYLLNLNGTRSNVLLSTEMYQGETSGSPGYLVFILIYAPNGPNDTITNAPTLFYNSSYYRGFFLGNLGKGFSLAYPTTPLSGINYVNYTQKVVIYQLDNFSGTLPTVMTKPSYVTNNYTLPG